MKSARGFSLVELMVTLSVAAILLIVAAPSFVTLIKNSRLTTVTNDLLSDLASARSEAAKRGLPVTICISTNGTSCTGTDWMGGRLVFSDTGNAGEVDGSDTIIRITEAKNNGIALTSSGFDSSAYISYSPTGTAINGVFTICDDRSGNFGKVVSISNTGRPSLATAQACP